MCTIVDNAANCVETFNEFGIQRQKEANDDDDDEMTSDDNDDEDDDNEETMTTNHQDSDAQPEMTTRAKKNGKSQSQAEVEIVDIGELLQTPTLPQHVRCASHSLNLIVSADIEKAIAQKVLITRDYRSAIVDCAQLWNLLNRSSHKASDDFRKTFGRSVRLPCSTRWNSLFDALVDITRFVETTCLLFSNFKLYLFFSSV